MTVTLEDINAALATVQDPEINRPITEIGMVKSVDVDRKGRVRVGVWLTISSCPMQTTIRERVVTAVSAVAGVASVDVELDVMSDEQRSKLRTLLTGREAKEIVFNRPDSMTLVYAIASGKGGVGKSSLTANLAVAMAADGLKVGLLDADIYGHSIPRILGVVDPPTRIGELLMPPVAHGVKVVSMASFKPGGASQPVALRGPMLHRYVESFLSDVWWGDLDVLLLDLPPGTGDVAMSVPQLVPGAQVVVVTTPQIAAAEVAVRAGTLAASTNQRVVGVIENMSGFPCPHCGEPVDLFGVGGGAAVSEQLSAALGSAVPLLERIPLDMRLREDGDAGRPFVLDQPESPAALAITSIASTLGRRSRGLAGRSLGLTPARGR